MSFVCNTKKRKIKAEMCSMNWGGGNLSGMKGVERQQEAHVKNEGCHWEGVGRISWVFSNISEQRRETNIKKETKTMRCAPAPPSHGQHLFQLQCLRFCMQRHAGLGGSLQLQIQALWDS